MLNFDHPPSTIVLSVPIFPTIGDDRCQPTNAEGLRMRRMIALILILQWVACASPKPVLYPNAHLEEVGEKASQEDIAACMALADAADLDSNQAAEAAKRTAGGAAVGSASGAVGGAIGGGGAGTGALVGLGVGSVVGFFSWMFSSKKPEPVYINYVNLCLGERGYQTVGWK
jgi:outer membrane lipoprotein SlyB